MTKIEELKNFYKELGYVSFAELARDIGVHRSTVSSWMTGRNAVPVPILALLEYKVNQKKSGNK